MKKTADWKKIGFVKKKEKNPRKRNDFKTIKLKFNDKKKMTKNRSARIEPRVFDMQ